jgi:hypothetical protein
MKVFIIGVIFGIILATVGFNGVCRMLDNSVDAVKTQSKNLSK